MGSMFYYAILLVAYALGSIPTAVLFSRINHGVDIRTLGDGNMGARNTKRLFGFYGGFIVAVIDIIKGALAVLLASSFKLPFEWQLLTGIAVILGHDFPAFAQFQGGQGFATTTGIFLVLFPLQTMIGAVIYFFLYLFFHNSDLAASVGMGLLALLVYLSQSPLLAVGFIILTLLFIPFKQWLDKPRRERIRDEQLVETVSIKNGEK